MATRPKPLFGFASDVNHDTWRNIKANGEFVVNMVGENFGPLMATMEQDLPYEVSEIKECGLTERPSLHICPPRIKEAFGWLECKMTEYFSVSHREIWIVGEIIEAEVKDNAIADVVNVEQVKPLNHIWGDIFVTDMKPTKFKRM
jgi:flavin reductase (DIM6/NTAB) family NADH-FMN oxidoreductase RutF